MVDSIRRTIGFALALLALAVPAVGRAEDLVIEASDHTLTVSPLADTILRVRIAPTGHPAEDASWAVSAATRARRVPARIEGSVLATAALRVSVDPATLALVVRDTAGRVVVADQLMAISRDGDRFTLRKVLSGGEHIFALGDKTGGLDRRGRSFVNWNTDAYGFRSGDDPLYRSIPFYIAASSSGAYGLFLDNTFRTWFDFGHRDPATIEIGAEDGPIDYYVIAGGQVADVVRDYTGLTGRVPLPPRWLLGYQQSRWSYMSEAEVRELAARLRRERIPTDVIWLDIDYQDRNRPFTIDRTTFPHFETMVSDLKALGLSVVTIADLHVANLPGQGYAPFDSGVAGDHFVHAADGSRFVAPVWPGPAVFPDFTRAETRAWWGGLHKPLLDAGVAGIWNDMDEPAVFETPTKTMPLDVLHRISGDGFAGRTTSHREVHNIYGMENSRATYEGLRALRPDTRAFVMTRASFAGGQRYAATWTGDNSSTWDHLRLAVQQGLSLGLSGFALAGSDVGGFTGGPGADLLTRWFQYAAFAPIFRDHSQKDAPRAEPWVDGERHLAIRRRYVEERYRLLPFLYGLAETAARTGDPMMRPVFYDDPAMLDISCDTAMTFTLGGRLLIAGAPQPESPRPYQACLPPGDWFDYWTGARVAAGPLMLTPQIDTLPVYVRAGTILPRQPLVQSTAERPGGPLELHIYPGPACRGDLYDDDGTSMAFARGASLRQTVTCESGPGGISSIRFAERIGSFAPWWTEIAVVIHGPTPGVARLGNRLLALARDGTTTRLTIPDQRGAATIRFGKD